MYKFRVRYIILTIVIAVTFLLWINFRAIFGPILRNELNIAQRVPSAETKQQNLFEKTSTCHYDINDFEAMVVSIRRALQFFEVYLKELIVDAAIGTRILEGQLQLVLRSFSLPSKIRKQLEELLLAATNISQRIVSQFVDVMTANEQTASGEKRLKQNLHWIEGASLWEMPAPGEWKSEYKLHLLMHHPADDSSITFQESQFSDRCIGAVFDDCAVPEDCFTLFLEKRRSEYYITHAIIFLLFSKKKNCFNNEKYMETWKSTTKLGKPENIFSSFCEKIWLEAKSIEEAGFPIGFRDLFAEQVMACSMAGFPQFLNPSWLKTLLSWQSKELLGCFELPHNDFSKTFDEIYTIKKEGHRVKRYDHIISAGTQNCSAHFTGVSIACIGLHFRYCIESCAGTLFQD